MPVYNASIPLHPVERPPPQAEAAGVMTHRNRKCFASPTNSGIPRRVEMHRSASPTCPFQIESRAHGDEEFWYEELRNTVDLVLNVASLFPTRRRAMSASSLCGRAEPRGLPARQSGLRCRRSSRYRELSAVRPLLIVRRFGSTSESLLRRKWNDDCRFMLPKSLPCETSGEIEVRPHRLTPPLDRVHSRWAWAAITRIGMEAAAGWSMPRRQQKRRT